MMEDIIVKKDMADKDDDFKAAPAQENAAPALKSKKTSHELKENDPALIAKWEAEWEKYPSMPKKYIKFTVKF